MKWWILVLVTVNGPEDITVKAQDRYDFGPTCKVAAEGRNMLSNDLHRVYVCVKEERPPK